MCGIPYHKESDYVKKLIDKGFKVAIDGGEELIQKGNEQPENSEKKYSPLGRRYLEAQKEYPDHLVMMLVLDSYEFYGEDDVIVYDPNEQLELDDVTIDNSLNALNSVKNILLLGLDSRSKGNITGRSDTMMLRATRKGMVRSELPSAVSPTG